MESNIITFPKAKKNHPPQSLDEVMETVTESRKEHIELFMENILPFIFSAAADMSLDLAKEECTKSTALFVESFKSALYDTCGLDHVLQQFAEQSFEFLDDDFVMESKSEPNPENSVDIIKE